MTQQELNAIKSRCSSAAAGPWHVSGDIKHIVFDNRGTQKKINGIVALCDRIAPIIDKIAIKTIQANAAFIAHARTDIPTLLAEVERLEDENNKLIKANACLITEQPIRCEECKHYHYYNELRCDLCNKVLLLPDDFCSYGERKIK